VSVTPGYIDAGEDETLIDLKDSTLMPGLMDMHTHVDTLFTAEAYYQDFFREPTDKVLEAVPWVRHTLMAGFTTVRNLGGDVDMSPRDAIEAGHIPGPRIYSAGKSIATTGGARIQPTGCAMTRWAIPVPLKVLSMGPITAREAVRRRYENGADVIKLTVTGGVLSLAKSGDNPQFTSAARLLRIDDKLGSVKEGKLADLVAVPGNPLQNIELMGKVNFVMKEGGIHKNVKADTVGDQSPAQRAPTGLNLWEPIASAILARNNSLVTLPEQWHLM